MNRWISATEIYEEGLKGCHGGWLGTRFVLLEDLGCIPSMHMEAHNHP